MTNLKKKSKKADLFWLIGMELLKPKKKLRKKLKQPFVVFRSSHLFRETKNLVNVW